MDKIKFSHIYNKMPPEVRGELEVNVNLGAQTRLLEVLTSDSRDLSPDFINYDTAYYANSFQKDLFNIFEGHPGPLPINYYPLPTGKILILILQTKTPGKLPVLWTTIRRHTTDKENYYLHLRGQVVQITKGEPTKD